MSFASPDAETRCPLALAPLIPPPPYVTEPLSPDPPLLPIPTTPPLPDSDIVADPPRMCLPTSKGPTSDPVSATVPAPTRMHTSSSLPSYTPTLSPSHTHIHAPDRFLTPVQPESQSVASVQSQISCHTHQSNLFIPLASPWQCAVLHLFPSECALAPPQPHIHVDRLNAFFVYHNCFASYDDLLRAFPRPHDSMYVVHALHLRDLLRSYKHFTQATIWTILKALGIKCSASTPKEALVKRLLASQDLPGPLFHVFKTLPLPRTSSARDSTLLAYSPSRPLKRKAEDPLSTEARRAKLVRQVQASKHSAALLAAAAAADAESTIRAGFPHMASPETRDAIISDFQAAIHPDSCSLYACAVCQLACFEGNFAVVSPRDIDFTLLCNPEIPVDLLPTEYDHAVYHYAILYPPGMHSLTSLGPVNLCVACHDSLVRAKPRLPEFALANWYYYALKRLPPDVYAAFMKASLFDLMLISRCRSARITHRFTENPDFNGDPSTAQSYSKGHTIVLPQDPTGVRKVLPPAADEINAAMCALFVGNTEPTPQNLERLGPVMTSKTITSTLIDFLLTRNPYYRDTGMSFSQDNLDDLFGSGDSNINSAIPRAIEIGFIPLDEGLQSGTADYTERDRAFHALNPEDSTNLIMDPVGYTLGDHSPQNTQLMRATALSWCRRGRPFIKSQSGSSPMSEKDEAFLTSLWPHLDPLGLGSLVHPKRDTSTSFERQVKHLLNLHDSPFQRDPTFAYICYDILTRADVNSTMSFRIKDHRRNAIVAGINSLSLDTLDALQKKWMRDPLANASTPEEDKTMKVLNKLKHISHSLKGSAGSKVKMRNEIRGLMNVEGTPALFITVNPFDIHHPLIRILAGEKIPFDVLERGEDLSAFHRAMFVAKNPAAAAIFFDKMIRTFIECVLRPNNGPGLFGHCNAYYGTVETQGRGTLHCHMLIWLKGNLNPQALRDKMLADPEFEDRMIQWLDSIIFTAPPGVSEVIAVDPSAPRPAPPADEPDPRAMYLKQLTPENRTEFWNEFPATVGKLAYRCNFHVHNKTCWKHLTSKSQPRDDAHCRMGSDGTTRPTTTLDRETGALTVRKLHPRLNFFNDIIIYLEQCNMDLKHIGSGEAAKALIFYVTDYITKSTLPVHAGLAALSYAIRQNTLKFENVADIDPVRRDSSLLLKSVHAMMGKLEISHQQVMSYLVGGGDHYTGHSFDILRWGDFDRWVRHSMDVDEEIDAKRPVPARRPEVIVSMGPNVITTSSQVYDYRYRPNSLPFDDLSLWDFVSRCTKMAGVKEFRSNGDAEGCFSSPLHPQRQTHRMTLRNRDIVPVLLGPSILKRSDDPGGDSAWCRAMLILFKPWREIADLKAEDVSWRDSYDTFAMPAHSAQIIQNMNIQYECEDARNTYSALRRAGKIQDSLLPGLSIDALENAVDEANLEDALCGDEALDDDDSDDDNDDDNDQVPPNVVQGLAPREQNLMLSLMKLSQPTPVGVSVSPDGTVGFRKASDEDSSTLAFHANRMKLLKTKVPTSEAVKEAAFVDRAAGTLREPKVSADTVGEYTVLHRTLWADDRTYNDPLLEVDRIIDVSGLRGNEEQERAFRLVAEHFLSGSSEQMLMFLGGVAGTGKSHVIRAIVMLFESFGVPEALFLSAPTGIAAVLIEGYTIHSLTLLPGKKGAKPDVNKLQDIWRNIRWLVLDEISMIAATFLSKVSYRMAEGKGCDPRTYDRPFGGVNVVAAGDFGQLMPVGERALFHNEFVSKMSANTALTMYGLGGLHGAFLWRRYFTTHVELLKNWRQQNDPKYGNLVGRIRKGVAWSGLQPHSNVQLGDGDNYAMPDYLVLMQRRLEVLAQNPTEFVKFADAPCIVTRKALRDQINRYRIARFAAATNQQVMEFQALDRIGNRAATPIEQERLLRLTSSVANDSLGRLPLVAGMRVMITENLALSHKVVNGSEGELVGVIFEEGPHGENIPLCAYVKVDGSSLKIDDRLSEGVVPILPTETQFQYIAPGGERFWIKRKQLPLLPAYAFTDYKVQGRTLDCAIVDLSGCRSLQSLYVMLSRVKTLGGLAILQYFTPNKMMQSLPQQFRNEFDRLRALHDATKAEFDGRKPLRLEDVDPTLLSNWAQNNPRQLLDFEDGEPPSSLESRDGQNTNHLERKLYGANVE